MGHESSNWIGPADSGLQQAESKRRRNHRSRSSLDQRPGPGRQGHPGRLAECAKGRRHDLLLARADVCCGNGRASSADRLALV